MSGSSEQTKETETETKTEAVESKDSVPAKPKKKGNVKVGRYLINQDAPIPGYDNGPVKAYKATTQRDETGYFAYVCEPSVPPRHGKRSAFNRIINDSVIKMVSHGVAYWPLASQERYFFIYEDRLGEKLLSPKAERAMGIKQDIVLENFVKPMTDILMDFRDKDVIHASIRPDNIYTRGSKDMKKILLGDCLTTPSGYLQDAVYEPIERAMTQNIAKGPGIMPSDMYSFGATIAVLLRHTDPMKNLSQEEIVLKKIDQGSYSALTSGDRFTGSILELLRGILHDDPTQRWNIDEVSAWVDGRRLSPKQADKKVLAPRPIVFGNKKYFSPILLSLDLVKNPEDVVRIVEDGILKNWINRAIEDPNLWEKMEEAINASKKASDPGGYADRLACNLSMELDSQAPIRYKNLVMNPDGVGSGLAQAFALKENLQAYADLFSNGIVLNWIKSQISTQLDITALISKFDNCRTFIKQANIGFGLERCLYALNPDAHCVSERFQNYHVLNPEDVIFAYEDMCQKGKSPSLFIDRHIAAFLSVKDSRSIDSYLVDLNSPDHHRKVVANLHCLASLQTRHKLPMFSGVSMAINDQLHIVYKRYHDKKVRENLKKNIVRYAQEGDLGKMSNLLSNMDLKKKDFSEFKKAMKEYSNLSMELEKLKERLQNKSKFGIATGQEVSALVSSVLASIIILVIAFLYFTDHSIF